MKQFRDNSVIFYTLTAISIFLIFVIAYANTYVNMDTELYVRPETFISRPTYPSSSLVSVPAAVAAVGTPADTAAAPSNLFPTLPGGLDGLKFDNYSKESDGGKKSNDVFANAKGSLSCKSYGLMNSRGPLCLDEEQIQLYTTRGGNASEVAAAPSLL